MIPCDLCCHLLFALMERISGEGKNEGIRNRSFRKKKIGDNMDEKIILTAEDGETIA